MPMLCSIDSMVHDMSFIRWHSVTTTIKRGAYKSGSPTPPTTHIDRGRVMYILFPSLVVNGGQLLHLSLHISWLLRVP